MISSGTSALCAVHVLGDGADLVVGEAPERVLHQLEVVVEVARARCWSASDGEELGGRGTRRRTARAPSSGAGVDAPHRLAADQPGGQVVRRRRRRTRRRAWPRPRPCRRSRASPGPVVDRGGGVGEVVGEHLVLVGAAAGGEVADRPADHVVGELDHVGPATRPGRAAGKSSWFGHRSEATDAG